MATLIDGKAFAATVRNKVGQAVSALKAEHDLLPGLAVVLVGDDPASQVYVRNKGKQTLETGMQSFEHRLADTTTEEELLHLIEQLNHDARVHGILVQLPLPAQIDSHAVINSINPDKDVDGFHLVNVGRLATGAPGLVPCTPLGCMMLLKNQIDDLTGANAVIVGRSDIVGKPMGALLMAQHCTVTTAHSRTRELLSVCREADILVAAVGRAQMISGDWIKPGAVVIDVGINRIEGEGGKTRLVGDVDFASAAEVAGAITPVPGGVGPMTIACLLRNTVQAACAANGIAFSLD